MRRNLTTDANSAALFCAIVADPSDTFARLVYADWLDEHGDDADRLHAEFIRVQCELAKIIPTLTEWSYDLSAQVDALRRRERELLEAHGKKWLQDMGLPEGECAVQ